MTCPECGVQIYPQPVIVTDPELAARHYCILCGLSGRETGKIVIGMHGGICCGCVELAGQLVGGAGSLDSCDPSGD